MHIGSKGVQIVNEHGKLMVRSAMDIAYDAGRAAIAAAGGKGAPAQGAREVGV